MTDETKTFGLTGREPGAAVPVLMGVQANGRLDGVLFNLTLRQTYRNTSDSVLEVIYTFPLPMQAVLLGFASELNGERKVGTVVAKRAAERQYEDALAEGDAPVMVEALEDGLHTANIGNVKPGDELVLEVRFAEALAFEQGRLRLAIPTTIAPRYGNAASAGLQPQQEPPASLLAEYPLALAVTIAGPLADGSVECPTHQFTRQAVDGGLQLDLAPGAWLDRDVVIVVKPREPLPSLVIQARDAVPHAAPVVVMAALQPPLATQRKHIALKLLVDCSGSMGGDSIASARVALHGALAGLTEHDHVSVSRFGSTVEHVLAPSACTPQKLRWLRPAVDAIDATLGGTEMEAALQAVFALPVPRDCAGADVLLVTDGEIWQAQEMIAAAQASGHRVFAIGVGSSPAEGVLRALAEATGGACEFATPGEALEAAAGRMLVRIRQQPWRDARIDWGCLPVWQTALPTSVFGGDTVIAFAGMSAPAAAPTVRLLAVDTQGAQTEVARGEADAPCTGDTLPRIAAARRMARADEGAALELAVAYQLMSLQTNCILVHQRAAADKAAGDAELHRVSSMLAAGWGATSTVMESAFMAYSTTNTPSVWRSVRSATSAVADSIRFSRALPDDLEIPAFLRKQSDESPPASLQAMVAAVFEHLSHGGNVLGLASHCDTLDLHANARLALDEAVALGLSIDDAWLMLAHWANRRPAGMADATVAAALQPHLDAIDAGLFAHCTTLFDRILGAYESDSWALSRTRRLREAFT
ncbi:MAG: VIT and VWA domain-containing protein, partial [Burkholderiales bacterium]